MAEDEGWENVERSFDGIDPNLIVVQLDLPRLGELIARVASKLCELREIEPFDVDSDEARNLAIDGWRYVCHMTDRAEFARSVASDLQKLDEPKPPTHARPIGWDPPV